MRISICAPTPPVPRPAWASAAGWRATTPPGPIRHSAIGRPMRSTNHRRSRSLLRHRSVCQHDRHYSPQGDRPELRNLSRLSKLGGPAQLCLVAVLGLALGELRFGGIGLGIAGVLFAGIGIGHVAKLAEITLDAAMLDFVREFGLILFVYSIDVQVGPGFFSALKRSGLALNLLAFALVVMSVMMAMAIHLGARLPLPVVLRLFAGAVTNTPSLGAAQGDRLNRDEIPHSQDSCLRPE